VEPPGLKSILDDLPTTAAMGAVSQFGGWAVPRRKIATTYSGNFIGNAFKFAV